MKRKAEEPTWHLPISPSVSRFGELSENAWNYDTFIAGRFVDLPLDSSSSPSRKANPWAAHAFCVG